MATEIKITKYYKGNVQKSIELLNDVGHYELWWPLPFKKVSDTSFSTELSELYTEIQVERLSSIHPMIVSHALKKGFFRGIIRWDFTPDAYLDNHFKCTHYATLRGLTEGIDDMLDTYLFQTIYEDYINKILSASGLIPALKSRDKNWNPNSHHFLEIPSRLNNIKTSQPF
ncbi:hypothetical protein [Croceiramulus getboli]|nr:hypothetical protein P8624_06850 [Flavobacteriaceae bacterium YJPT1-3]